MNRGAIPQIIVVMIRFYELNHGVVLQINAADKNISGTAT